MNRQASLSSGLRSHPQRKTGRNWAIGLALLILGSFAQAEWSTSVQLSGSAFLTPGLLSLHKDTDSSPVGLWLDRGTLVWSDSSTGTSCAGCHGQVNTLQKSAVTHPKLSADGSRLVNLEDQILNCRTRTGKPAATLEDEDVLALSALLHKAAQGLPFQLAPAPLQTTVWQTRLAQGAQAYTQRIGRMNLACVHCHDQNIGKQMRADVISPGHPTGFPVYRMSWQKMGSIDRRLRACYSGVQAQLPAPAAPVLRDLELYLKVRAQNTSTRTPLTLDGPSIRR